jgi:hypothetical protein
MIDLIDETFDTSQSINYALCIQIAPNGLSYCVCDTVVGKYILFRHYPFSAGCDIITSCSKVFEKDELLSLRYKKSRSLWVSQRSTLVPEQLFDAQNVEKILNFNHGSLENEKTLFRQLHPTQLYHVFSVPVALANLVARYQQNIQWFHHAQPFIEWSIAKEKPVSVFIYKGNMDVVLLKNEQFAFYNSYQVQTPMEAVYFLAGVLEVFGLNLSTAEVVYSDSEEASPYSDAIKAHSLRLIGCEPGGMCIYSHYITEVLRKRFIHLFNLHGCVS